MDPPRPAALRAGIVHHRRQHFQMTSWPPCSAGSGWGKVCLSQDDSGVINTAVVFKSAAKVAVILAVALSLGVHWALLQGVAWAGMVVSFAQETSIQEAVTKTFNGKNPCRLCKLVREGQQSEKTKESLLPVLKIESLPCAAVFVLTPPVPLSSPTAPDETASPRAESPPSPPPRAA